MLPRSVQAEVPVAALLGPNGVRASTRPLAFPSPAPSDGMVGVHVSASIGDYRSGDAIWCRRIGPEEFASALNHDILFPRPAGRFLFGRLIGREGDRLQLLPLGSGARQLVLTDPPWAAVAVQLVRRL